MHFDPEIEPSRHDLNLRPGQGPNESYNRVWSVFLKVLWQQKNTWGSCGSIDINIAKVLFATLLILLPVLNELQK